MQNKTKTAGKTATESVGVTETQTKSEDVRYLSYTSMKALVEWLDCDKVAVNETRDCATDIGAIRDQLALLVKYHEQLYNIKEAN